MPMPPRQRYAEIRGAVYARRATPRRRCCYMLLRCLPYAATSPALLRYKMAAAALMFTLTTYYAYAAFISHASI